MEHEQDYWIALFDEVGGGHAEAQPIRSLRKETIARYVEDVETGVAPAPQPLSLDDYAERMWTKHVMAARDRRAQRLRIDLDYLLDGFKDDGAYLDPMLAQVHRIGDQTDKVLRLWTPEDLHDCAYRRLAAAVDVAAAAQEFKASAEALIDELVRADLVCIGERFA